MLFSSQFIFNVEAKLPFNLNKDEYQYIIENPNISTIDSKLPQVIFSLAESVTPSSISHLLPKFDSLPTCRYPDGDCFRGFRDFGITDTKNSFCFRICGDNSWLVNGTCTSNPAIYEECSKRENPNKIKDFGDISCQLDESTISEEQRQLLLKQSFGICKVKYGTSDWIINDCESESEYFEEILTFLIIQHKNYLIEGFQVSKRFDYHNINSYYCNGTCAIENCARGFCNGDLDYCKSFSCKRDSLCVCKYMPKTGVVQFKINNEIFKPRCWGFFSAMVKRQLPVSNNIIERKCPKCTAVCFKNYIEIRSPDEKPKLVRICKNPNCVENVNTGNVMNISVPPQMIKSHGDFKVEIWFHGALNPYSILTSCDSHDHCYKTGCFFCKETWVDPDCITSAQYLFIIVPIFIITILSIYLLHIELRQYKRYNLFLNRFKYSKVSKEDGVKSKMITKDTAVKFRKSKKDDKESEAFINNSTKTSRRPSISLSDVVLFILALLVNPVIMCSDVVSLSADATSCKTTRDGVSECSLTHTHRVSLAPIGQEACYNIIDPANKNIGLIKIIARDLQVVCRKRTLYYVPNAVPNCKSTVHCHSVDNCYDNKCSEIGMDYEREEWGDANEKLGWSDCLDGSGGWPYGCFNVNPSCVFLRAYFTNPTKEVFEIFKCEEWDYQSNIDILVYANGKESRKSYVVNTSFQVKSDNYSLSLITVTKPEIPAFSECLVKNVESFYLSKCSDIGEIVKGRVGEIQCPNYKDAEVVTRKCKAEENLIRTKVNGQDLTCISEHLSVKQAVSKTALPFKAEGFTIYPYNDTVIMTFNGHASLELQIDFLNFVLRKTYEENVCKVTFVSITGCFNCKRGAILRIKTHTDFGNAIGFITCKSFKFPIMVSSTVETRNFTVSADKSVLDEKCSISCPAGDTDFFIKGVLKGEDYISPLEHDEVHSLVIDDGKSFKFSDWFQLPHLSFLLYFIIGFFIFIALLLILKLILRLFK